MTCSSCGAAARPDAPWCGQCHQPLGAPAAAPEVPSVPGRPVPAAAPVRAVPTYSRWRKTDTSFGPVGRVAWTVAMLVMAGLAVFSGNPFAIGPVCLVAVPLVLRSVWASSRVS